MISPQVVGRRKLATLRNAGVLRRLFGVLGWDWRGLVALGSVLFHRQIRSVLKCNRHSEAYSCHFPGEVLKSQVMGPKD